MASAYRRRARWMATAVFLFGLSPLAAQAAGTPALVPLCASCHGEQGISASPIIPDLAGQQQGYLDNALHDYKANQRQGGSAAMMNGIAAHLSDADIAALSAYYAALKRN
ncbi:c-type cytochrome [Acidisoma cellulosilytica]|uniref:C-type cytochrome n=1 Tax=Acidisoma cellulosilyticum TaxID=2802395 RepID=A0A963YY95_9PROT|nr:c-type cytochrome [Acidisoma cellulosilyticum]MCB8879448.1 c-type cytochrome [Acidisoma cellulosilyticum]